MTEYIVGLRLGKRSEVLTIEAEDALIAALKAKCNHPEALISYVRKSNRRGDRRNPHRPRVMRGYPRGYWRSVDRGAHRPAIEPRKYPHPGSRRRSGDGRQHGWAR